MITDERWRTCLECDVRWYGTELTCWNCDTLIVNNPSATRPYLTSQYSPGSNNG